MRKLIVPLAMLAMAILLGAAVAIDCVRLANDAAHRVELADAEMVKNEIRLVTQLEQSTKTTPDVHAAIENLKAIHDRPSRLAKYDSLVSSFRNTMSAKVDPNNPLDRKLMDDLAGAMNRRDVAQKQCDIELADYQAFINSWRGKVAQAMSTSVRRDAAKWAK
jgi:hypothetical protein